MNNTSSQLASPNPWRIEMTLGELLAWITPCSIVAMMAIIGNSLVIAAFVRAINLQSRLHYFMVGLAAADIMVGIISIPMWNYILYLTWEGNVLSEAVVRTYEALDVFAGVNSILHLMAISTERLYATVRPYSWSHRSYSKMVYFGALVIIWVLSAVISSLFAIPDHGVIDNVRFHLMNTFFFLPLVVICITYAAIGFGFQKRTHLRPGHAGETSIRLTLTLFIVIGLFVVTWLPFFVVRFILKGCQHFCVSWRVFYFTKFLHFSNSGINPIVYGLRIPQYRTFLMKILRLRKTKWTTSQFPAMETEDIKRRSFRGDMTNGHARNSKRASTTV